jgi:hypothetical protein
MGPAFYEERSTERKMNREDFPAPREGVIVTHFLVVRDQDTSREWYRSVFGAEVVNERDPVMLKFHNSWLILNVGGGPTDDKPDVTLEPPADPSRTSASSRTSEKRVRCRLREPAPGGGRRSRALTLSFLHPTLGNRKQTVKVNDLHNS